MVNFFNDEFFMRQALQEANQAYELGEVPIGAVIVANNIIIAKAHNLTERLKDVTSHAEIQAITSASEQIGGKYLKDCTLYVTLEPCVMCAGALFWAQIGKVVFAARDENRGATRIKPSLFHPKTLVTGGVLEQEAKELLQRFFQGRRN